MVLFALKSTAYGRSPGPVLKLEMKMNKNLLPTVSCLGIAASYSAGAALVGAYDFTGGSLADSSGNGNNAAVSEGAFPGSGLNFTNGAVVDGVRGDVYDLSGGGLGGNGSDGGVNLNLPVAGNNTGAWSLAMWVREADASGDAYIFDNRNTATGAPAGGDRMIISIGQGSGTAGPKAWNGAVWVDGGTPAVNDGDWHHVAWVYDGTNFTAYVDGAPGIVGGTAAAFADLLLEDIEIGNEGTGGGAGGQESRLVDSIRVYNHALTANEVQALYIPEPTSLAMLTLGGLLVSRRRRA